MKSGVPFWMVMLCRVDARLGVLEEELAGLPELMAKPFASRYGYRSGNLEREDEPQWVVIDLGREEEITRLVAVPVNVPAIGARGTGYGFPVAGVKGRYVRFTAARRWRRAGPPAAAVDGFGSRHKLVELPEYLDLIARRGALEKERDALQEKRAAKLRTVDLVLGYGGGGLGLAAALGWGWGWGWVFLRQRIMSEKAVAQLRDQIARDLHDDIGSNLGGITPLSEIGQVHSSDPRAREDFGVIKEAADEASASMRDIVWLIGGKGTGLRDQVSKMRESAQLMLGDRGFSITVEPENFRDRSLNNIRKHSGATMVEVGIRLDATHLTFSIRDDGVGFEPQGVKRSGHGLANLRRRAERLGGSVRIESTPGDGSAVTFSAPLKS